MIFVGYEPGSKANRVYDPTARRVHINRDVVFDEEARWEWGADPTTSSDGEFEIEYTTMAHPEVTTMLQSQPQEDAAGPSTPALTPLTMSAPTIMFTSPSSRVDEDLDAEHDDNAPLRFCTIDNILGLARPLCMALKWVFKTKKDATRIVTHDKARLVTKVYVQRPGIDYDKVFALVARLESVQLLLALAANEGWPVHHREVKSAFLNGELQEKVYVTQPPRFVVASKELKVLHLIKALYGLRQAPRARYAKLDASLASLGFQRSTSEHAVYTRGKGTHQLIVGVYVDDLAITGGDIIKLK